MGGAFQRSPAWLLTGLLVGGGLMGGEAANAHTSTFSSTVTICERPSEPCPMRESSGGGKPIWHVQGTVSSQRAKCVSPRKVIVKALYGGPFERIGADITDSEGRWQEDVPTKSGGTTVAEIKVRVKRVHHGGANHGYFCEGDIATLVNRPGGTDTPPAIRVDQRNPPAPSAL